MANGPNLFTNSFGGGLEVGQRLADMVQERRNRSRLQQIADMLSEGDFNAAGADLVAMGQVAPGIRTLNIPHARQAQADQSAFRREQFESDADFRERQFAERQRQNRESNALAAERINAARARTDLDLQGGFTKPQQGIDEEGNPIFFQTNDRNEIRIVDGITPNNPIKTINTGTETIVIDSRTGQEIARTKNDVSGKAEQTAVGKARGEAKAALPAAQNNANLVLKMISDLEAHPGLDDSFGLIQGRLPSELANPRNAQNVENFRVLQRQLGGQVFLQAFERLKGAGQITEIEGQKATDALLAMQRTQDAQQFRNLLKDFRENVQRGMRLARERAGANNEWQDLGNGVRIREKR